MNAWGPSASADRSPGLRFRAVHALAQAWFRWSDGNTRGCKATHGSLHAQVQLGA